MEKHIIFDRGIAAIRAAKSVAEIEKMLHGSSLDVSCVGYVWETERHLAGAEHEITETELAELSPFMAKWIDTHLPYAIRSPRLSLEQKIEIAKSSWNRAHFLLPVMGEMSDTQILNIFPEHMVPDRLKPYSGMTDEEIISAVPAIRNLTGNRTRSAIQAIKDMPKNIAPALCSIQVVYKSTWKPAKNQIRIGQTNGAGGRCKQACFLSW